MEKKKYYITTPIYYPSGKWHIGHCYTTVCCDMIARYKRMRGYDVFYLTGTDEHGQKIEKRALESGVTPKAFVDELVAEIKQLWSLLDISYSKYIRTTDEYHKAAVQKIFEKLEKNGDIYKSKYSGLYCTPCESFWTKTQAKDGNCPDCGRPVQETEEECYFFRLSKYQDRIKKLLTETDYLQPQSRVNEMVNNFIEQGLTDLAVSRTSFKWGIPVKNDEGHIIYVWIDALSNYITALGYGSDDTTLLDKYWPADLQMVGKEIVRFHSIIWSAILMALDLPLPKKIYGHGWLLLNGDKMSKSKGNVVDPFFLAERYGVDAIRYFLLREVPFGADGVYSNSAFISRTNQDLCNNLGNLVKRTIAMSNQYFAGKVTKTAATEKDVELIDGINALDEKLEKCIDALAVTRLPEEIMALCDKANKYIDLNEPWVLYKNKDMARLETVLYNLLEVLRVAAVALMPILTKTPKKIFDALNIDEPKLFEGNLSYGKVESYNVGTVETLFPRIDLDKELKELELLTEKMAKEKNVAAENGAAKEDKKMEDNGIITIDEFFKTKLVVAEVMACEKVEKSDKLLKSTLKVGDEVLTVLSGIAQYYTPEEMVGKKVVLVKNLAPRKMRGIESQGMILCASNENGLSLVVPEKDAESGTEVC